ncbi:Cobyrinic acid ac-diamide synthase [Thermanaerovibrio acidaminovorans DSM 6589]|uniref:Cobyrinic acid ac-diamide synthase n=1 Tax=Thermanaerovibrio acidaminovorans (strain ATCC 49978 / DSM 6589 / Su883) TaxID=525903 RepID=D1B7E6_THEAS|nr:AAA family ATPase [Thermanaerovibrio acidaminovorans]ACZ19937.1 Cobyrinic acid ac-diamide synthase [Thermanaerovibrio acidaminovorans DSM 6589]
MTVLAMTNQKGGVGKTSSCVNLSAALALKGKRVLLVDMDPQGNATSGLGIDRGALSSSVYELLLGDAQFDQVAVPCDVENLWVLPATIDLAGAEIELSSAISRESRLRKFRDRFQEYDLVFIDCPPSLGLLTLNALVAADKFVVPIQCEYYALEGLSQLLKTIDLVRQYLNPSIDLFGIILTMYDNRTRLSRDVAEQVRQGFPRETFETMIPRNVRVSESPSYGMPVVTYDPSSQGAQAYMELAKEVLSRCQGHLD